MILKRRGLKTSPFLFLLNTNMKDVLKQYFWIFSITAGILTAALLLLPDKKNRLEFIEEEIERVQTQQKILTEKEKELERMATEKDWEEVDKDNNK